MKENIKKRIIALYESCFNEKPESVEILPASGSYREYCRLINKNHVCIGAWNTDLKENKAFISFAQHLKRKGLNVPEILAIGAPADIYLQEDLGNTTLFDYLTQTREKEGFTDDITNWYKKVLKQLPGIQITGAQDIDWSCCYPRDAFDRQSMMWDLNYFKYYFLKLAKIPFDEQALEDDFQTFTNYLLGAGLDYFLYRDFQSRNIMLVGDAPYFIDFQGGRKGPLQYDLASLLFDAKADLPSQVREELLEYYLDCLSEYISVDRQQFRQYYYGYVIIRIMQAMGAYGFRGFYEKKEHFLKSIPFALNNLSELLKTIDIPVKIPELLKVLKDVTESEFLRSIGQAEKNKLTVRITSFSYKKGIPKDHSGNGGGFVFDCRAIHNPGRYTEYKTLTGKDEAVKEFLLNNSEIEEFLTPVFHLVEQSVRKYLERGFTNLCVNFGCTGGQHRSVYSAERLATHLRNNFPVNVVLYHREQDPARQS
ncbi:MAG: RNase adapter RapZ [Bacteroidota bacterium]|nr:RNase adapter RapZ [Bacteroidota bacterium]